MITVVMEQKSHLVSPSAAVEQAHYEATYSGIISTRKSLTLAMS
jgi:hypothetical protein